MIHVSCLCILVPSFLGAYSSTSIRARRGYLQIVELGRSLYSLEVLGRTLEVDKQAELSKYRREIEKQMQKLDVAAFDGGR